jgi:hypothetical protein
MNPKKKNNRKELFFSLGAGLVVSGLLLTAALLNGKSPVSMMLPCILMFSVAFAAAYFSPGKIEKKDD